VLAATERAALEAPVELLLLAEHLIDDARQLQGHQRARDPDRLLAGLGLEARPDLGVVLDGADGGVRKPT
jgi:hypothetical protein